MAGFSPSWERMEENKTVLLALRTHLFDGKPASKAYKDILHTDIMLVAASLTTDGISESNRLGIVPFGDGKCTIKRAMAGETAKIIEHYFSRDKLEAQISCQNNQTEIDLLQTRKDEILEWVEIIFEKESPVS